MTDRSTSLATSLARVATALLLLTAPACKSARRATSSEAGASGAGTQPSSGDRGVGDGDLGHSVYPDIPAPRPGAMGDPCALARDPERSLQLTFKAADCKSRICLRYGLFNPRRLPSCTRTCTRDSDCPRDPTASCPVGYVCRTGQTVGGIGQCCKLCVCRLDIPQTADPLAASCRGVAPRCPR